MSLYPGLSRLYSLSPSGITLGLDRLTRAACLLRDPQKQFLSVQVAGTNGKGSVSSLLAHAAYTAGLKTGLFTSPHLHRFTERIRIDGVECDNGLLEIHLSKSNDFSTLFPS